MNEANSKLRALFFLAGRKGYTSWMRAEAMERLGYEVTTVQMLDCLPSNIWVHRLYRRTGYFLLQPKIQRFLQQAIPAGRYDFAWIDHGLLLGTNALRTIRQHTSVLVNYNVDDPAGGRDGLAWSSYLRALPEYDLVTTVRRETEADFIAHHARKVMRVYFSYDEGVHRPVDLSEADRARWGCEVLFVGTWMEQRDRFIAGLIDQGIPMTIYGDHWQRAPLWRKIKPFHRGSAIYGADYARVVQCAKVNLGLLSRGNRDQHTQRSVEIPAMGGLLCAERTPEHQALYREGIEAEFWSSVEECAAKCRLLLTNPGKRQYMAEAGRQRVLALKVGHEDLIEQVLAAAGIPLPSTPDLHD